jgi:hypothetical protein
MVDVARPSALAIDRSDRPSAIRPASRSLSSAVRWEYSDMATPFSVSRWTDTSSALGVALHDGTHPTLNERSNSSRRGPDPASPVASIAKSPPHHL